MLPYGNIGSASLRAYVNEQAITIESDGGGFSGAFSISGAHGVAVELNDEDFGTADLLIELSPDDGVTWFLAKDDAGEPLRIAGIIEDEASVYCFKFAAWYVGVYEMARLRRVTVGTKTAAAPAADVALKVKQVS